MRERRIAFFTRASFSYHLQVGWGFFGAFNEDERKNWCVVTHEVVEADATIMRNQMRILLEKEHDLVVTVGCMRTQIAVQFMREHNIEIPHIFVGVSDPVRMGILPEMKPHKNITGVFSEQMPWDFMAKLLYRVRPNMKNVLIPYYKYAENGCVEEKLLLVKNFFDSVGIVCELHAVDAVQPYPRSVFDIVPSFDTVWSPEGLFFDVYSRDCIELCNKHGVTFFSNNRAHIGKGAALVLGADFELIGEAVYKQACKVLDDEKMPSEVPLLVVQNTRKMYVNMEAAWKQSACIDEAILLGMHRNEIIEGDEGAFE